jgi:hypothetical protein
MSRQSRQGTPDCRGPHYCRCRRLLSWRAKRTHIPTFALSCAIQPVVPVAPRRSGGIWCCKTIIRACRIDLHDDVHAGHEKRSNKGNRCERSRDLPCHDPPTITDLGGYLRKCVAIVGLGGSIPSTGRKRKSIERRWGRLLPSALRTDPSVPVKALGSHLGRGEAFKRPEMNATLQDRDGGTFSHAYSNAELGQK